MTITEFLEARIAEDEFYAQRARVLPDGVAPVVHFYASENVIEVYPAEDWPDLQPAPPGKWGWNGGPVDHDDPLDQDIRAALGKTPAAGIEMHPYYVNESGGWDESDPDSECVIAEIRPDSPGVAPHIARHDPVRVLAECKAKRAIIERYDYLGEHGDSGDARWVLQFLAQPYADHPDFDPEWRA